MSNFTSQRTRSSRGGDAHPTFHLFLDPPEPDAPKGQLDCAFINCDPSVGEQPENCCRTMISLPLARKYKRAFSTKYPPLPSDDGTPLPPPNDDTDPVIGEVIDVTLRNDDDGSRFDLPVTIEEFVEERGENYIRIGLADLGYYFKMETDGESIDLIAKPFDETGRECYPISHVATVAS